MTTGPYMAAWNAPGPECISWTSTMRRPFRWIEVNRYQSELEPGGWWRRPAHEDYRSRDIRPGRPCRSRGLTPHPRREHPDVDKDHIPSVSLLATDLSNRSQRLSRLEKREAGYVSSHLQSGSAQALLRAVDLGQSLLPLDPSYSRAGSAHRGVAEYSITSVTNVKIWRVQ